MNSKSIFLTVLCALSLATPLIQSQNMTQSAHSIGDENKKDFLDENTKRYLLFVAGYAISTTALYLCSIPYHNYLDQQMGASYMTREEFCTLNDAGKLDLPLQNDFLSEQIENFKELNPGKEINPASFYHSLYNYAVPLGQEKIFYTAYSALEKKHLSAYIIQNIAALAIGALFSKWAYNYLYQSQDELAEQTT